MAALIKGGGKAKSGRSAVGADAAVQGELFSVPEADLAWHVRAGHVGVGTGVPRPGALLPRCRWQTDCGLSVGVPDRLPANSAAPFLPLLKTRWLCKKERKRVDLTMTPNADKNGVDFGVRENVRQATGNSTARKASDKEVGGGTMSCAGATCPALWDDHDQRGHAAEGQAGRAGEVMTVVVVEGKHGKEYRLPTAEERRAAEIAPERSAVLFAEIPFGLPDEPVPQGASRVGGGSPFTVHMYGIDRWSKLFTPRQLYALGIFARHVQSVLNELKSCGYPSEWHDAIVSAI